LVVCLAVDGGDCHRLCHCTAAGYSGRYWHFVVHQSLCSTTIRKPHWLPHRPTGGDPVRCLRCLGHACTCTRHGAHLPLAAQQPWIYPVVRRRPERHQHGTHNPHLRCCSCSDGSADHDSPVS